MLRLWFVANILFWEYHTEIIGFKFGANVAVLMLAGTLWIFRKKEIADSSIKVLFILCVYVLFSYFVAIIGPCNDKLSKLIITAPIFSFLIFVGWDVGWSVSDNDWLKLQESAIWILLAAFVGFIIEALLPTSFPDTAIYRSEDKLSGLFSEPSYAAVSLFPVIVILLVAESKKIRYNGILALGALVLFSGSSTLMGLIVAWSFYRLFVQRNIKHFLYESTGLSFFVGLAAIIHHDRFVAPALDRIAGLVPTNKIINLSSLVYIQGWQDALVNLLRTKGLGLGFNMMGCIPLPDVLERAIIAKEYKLQLNVEDGSFLLSKIVSETGMIGVLFFVVIIWWLIRMEKNIRNYNHINRAEYSVLAIQAALIFSLIATFFLRTAGYFSGGILMLVVTISASVKWHRMHISKI
ncbi:conserved membrane hypothetical protein [Gammaproteobacteria bacterium]